MRNGVRALLLSFTEDGALPCHIVVQCEALGGRGDGRCRVRPRCEGMAEGMEKKKAKKTVERCQRGCNGSLRSTAVPRVFRRTASPVEVILENILAQVCTMCGRAFFSRQTAYEIDRLLAPFHG
jgi:hypothetical protein